MEKAKIISEKVILQIKTENDPYYIEAKRHADSILDNKNFGVVENEHKSK